jgi:hypothetical protein
MHIGVIGVTGHPGWHVIAEALGRGHWRSDSQPSLGGDGAVPVAGGAGLETPASRPPGPAPRGIPRRPRCRKGVLPAVPRWSWVELIDEHHRAVVAGAAGLEAAVHQVAERIKNEIGRMADAPQEAIEAGLVRPVPAEPATTFLRAAWDGVIACHLLPDHMGLSDADFETVLGYACEVLAAGLPAGQHEGDGS